MIERVSVQKICRKLGEVDSKLISRECAFLENVRKFVKYLEKVRLRPKQRNFSLKMAQMMRRKTTKFRQWLELLRPKDRLKLQSSMAGSDSSKHALDSERESGNERDSASDTDSDTDSGEDEIEISDEGLRPFRELLSGGLKTCSQMLTLGAYNRICLDSASEGDLMANMAQLWIRSIRAETGLADLTKRLKKHFRKSPVNRSIDRKFVRDLFYSKCTSEARIRAIRSLGRSEALPLVWPNWFKSVKGARRVWDINLELTCQMLSGFGVLCVELGDAPTGKAKTLNRVFQAKFYGSERNALHGGSVDVNLDFEFYSPRALVLLNRFGEWERAREAENAKIVSLANVIVVFVDRASLVRIKAIESQLRSVHNLARGKPVLVVQTGADSGDRQEQFEETLRDLGVTVRLVLEEKGAPGDSLTEDEEDLKRAVYAQVRNLESAKIGPSFSREALLAAFFPKILPDPQSKFFELNTQPEGSEAKLYLNRFAFQIKIKELLARTVSFVDSLRVKAEASALDEHTLVTSLRHRISRVESEKRALAETFNKKKFKQVVEQQKTLKNDCSGLGRQELLQGFFDLIKDPNAACVIDFLAEELKSIDTSLKNGFDSKLQTLEKEVEARVDIDQKNTIRAEMELIRRAQQASSVSFDVFVDNLMFLWQHKAAFLSAKSARDALVSALGLLLQKGFSLNLIQGDLVTESASALIDALRKVKGPEVLTIGCLGPQSSGKSTLLNLMFGTRFLTSQGRCTQGVGIELRTVRVGGVERGYLVVDTEGLNSAEKQNGLFDRKVTYWAIENIDVLVLNFKGDLCSSIKSNLETAFYLLRNRARCARFPRIHYVFGQNGNTSTKSTFSDQVQKIQQAVIGTQAHFKESPEGARSLRSVINWNNVSILGSAFKVCDFIEHYPSDSADVKQYFQMNGRFVEQVHQLLEGIIRGSLDLQDVAQPDLKVEMLRANWARLVDVPMLIENANLGQLVESSNLRRALQVQLSEFVSQCAEELNGLVDEFNAKNDKIEKDSEFLKKVNDLVKSLNYELQSRWTKFTSETMKHDQISGFSQSNTEHHIEKSQRTLRLLEKVLIYQAKSQCLKRLGEHYVEHSTSQIQTVMEQLYGLRPGKPQSNLYQVFKSVSDQKLASLLKRINFESIRSAYFAFLSDSLRDRAYYFPPVYDLSVCASLDESRRAAIETVEACDFECAPGQNLDFAKLPKRSLFVFEFAVSRESELETIRTLLLQKVQTLVRRRLVAIQTSPKTTKTKMLEVRAFVSRLFGIDHETVRKVMEDAHYRGLFGEAFADHQGKFGRFVEELFTICNHAQKCKKKCEQHVEFRNFVVHLQPKSETAQLTPRQAKCLKSLLERSSSFLDSRFKSELTDFLGRFVASANFKKSFESSLPKMPKRDFFLKFGDFYTSHKLNLNQVRSFVQKSLQGIDQQVGILGLRTTQAFRMKLWQYALCLAHQKHMERMHSLRDFLRDSFQSKAARPKKAAKASIEVAALGALRKVIPEKLQKWALDQIRQEKQKLLPKVQRFLAKSANRFSQEKVTARIDRKIFIEEPGAFLDSNKQLKTVILQEFKDASSEYQKAVFDFVAENAKAIPAWPEIQKMVLVVKCIQKMFSGLSPNPSNLLSFFEVRVQGQSEALSNLEKLAYWPEMSHLAFDIVKQVLQGWKQVQCAVEAKSARISFILSSEQVNEMNLKIMSSMELMAYFESPRRGVLSGILVGIMDYLVNLKRAQIYSFNEFFGFLLSSIDAVFNPKHMGLWVLDVLGLKEAFTKTRQDIVGCRAFCQFCHRKCESAKTGNHVHHSSKFGHNLRVFGGGVMDCAGVRLPSLVACQDSHSKQRILHGKSEFRNDWEIAKKQGSGQWSISREHGLSGASELDCVQRLYWNSHHEKLLAKQYPGDSSLSNVKIEEFNQMMREHRTLPKSIFVIFFDISPRMRGVKFQKAMKLLEGYLSDLTRHGHSINSHFSCYTFDEEIIECFKEVNTMKTVFEEINKIRCTGGNSDMVLVVDKFLELSQWYRARYDRAVLTVVTDGFIKYNKSAVERLRQSDNTALEVLVNLLKVKKG